VGIKPVKQEKGSLGIREGAATVEKVVDPLPGQPKIAPELHFGAALGDTGFQGEYEGIPEWGINTRTEGLSTSRVEPATDLTLGRAGRDFGDFDDGTGNREQCFESGVSFCHK
jgi:hypothetical protein